MPSITVSEARSDAEQAQAFDIRRRVFVLEQRIGEALEFDEHDRAARHLLARGDGVAIGTLRLRLLERGRIARIERVAVLAEGRGASVGQELMRAALELARDAGATSALVHAQTRVQGFYARLGFAACGREFMEDGIPHVAMRLPLTDAGGQGARQERESGGAG